MLFVSFGQKRKEMYFSYMGVWRKVERKMSFDQKTLNENNITFNCVVIYYYRGKMTLDFFLKKSSHGPSVSLRKWRETIWGLG